MHVTCVCIGLIPLNSEKQQNIAFSTKWSFLRSCHKEVALLMLLMSFCIYIQEIEDALRGKLKYCPPQVHVNIKSVHVFESIYVVATYNSIASFLREIRVQCIYKARVLLTIF